MERDQMLAKLETMSTKANTGFKAWWDLLNVELARRALSAAEFGEASGCYKMGECPETAAAALEAIR